MKNMKCVRGGVIARSRVSSGVIDSFRRDIITGVYAPGTQLTEQQIGDKYGISRSPVRAIFQQLEKEGMIKILDNGCKEVVEFTIQDVKDLYNFRKYLETEAVKKLLEKKSKNYVPLLRVLNDCQEDGSNMEQWSDIDFDFHRSLIEMSGDRYLLAAYDSIEPTIKALFALNREYLKQNYFDNFYKNHVSVVRELLTDNLEKCTHCIKIHIDGAMQKSVKMLEAVKAGAEVGEIEE